MRKKALLVALLGGYFLGAQAVEVPIINESAIVQQASKIQGTVVDETGEPIIGVTIQVKGKPNLGTITDVDGNFSINVSPKDVLVISFIGFVTQEIKVGNQTSLRITLKEDSEVLDEVVVTAFGTGQKKESVVGSIQTVRPSDLKVPSSNLSNSLPGVSPV